MRRSSSLVAALVVALSIGSPALAAEPVDSESAFDHVASSVLLAKFQRLFVRNVASRAALTDAIANRLLVTAAKQLPKNEKAAAATLAKFERESGQLQTLVDQLEPSDDARAAKVRDEVVADRATQASLLGETERFDEQEAINEHLATTLEDEADTDKRAELVATSLDHFAQSATDPVDQLGRKLELSAKLDDATEDSELESDLRAAEDVELEDHASELTDDQAELLATRLSERVSMSQQLVVLTKLLDKLPDAAKSALSTVINTIASRYATALTSNSQSIEQILKDSEQSTELQTKVLERLAEHADKATKQQIEVLKKQAESEREADKQAAEVVKKSQEQSAEAAKKANEQQKEQAKKAAEQQKESSSSGNSSEEQSESSSDDSSSSKDAESSTSSGSSSKSESSSQEAERETVEIKVKEGRFDGSTSFSLKSGTIVTVKFKSEDEVARTITLSNGTSGSVTKSSTTLASFTLTSPVTFTVSGVSGSGTISVK